MRTIIKLPGNSTQRRIKQILSIALLASLVVILTVGQHVNAETVTDPDGVWSWTNSSVVTFIGEDYTYGEGYTILSDTGWYGGGWYLFDDSNVTHIGVLYCVEKDNPFSTGASLNPAYPDEKIRLVLSNGFWASGEPGGPYSDVEGYGSWNGSNYRWLLLKYGLPIPTTQAEITKALKDCYAATQLAVWYFTDGINLMSYSDTSLATYAASEIDPVFDAVRLRTLYRGLVNDANNGSIIWPEVNVTFNMTTAEHKGTLYGPITVNVAASPSGLVPTLVTPLPGITLTGLNDFLVCEDTTGTLEESLSLSSGQSFYVQVGESMPTSCIELVKAEASINNLLLGGNPANASMFWDTYNQPAAQAMGGCSGSGRANVKGTATLKICGVTEPQVTEIPVVIPIEKVVSGDGAPSTDFVFTLKQTGGVSITPQENTVTINWTGTDETGTFDLGELPEGEYTFEIEETTGGGTGWVNDTAVRTVTVTVSASGTSLDDRNCSYLQFDEEFSALRTSTDQHRLAPTSTG